VPTGYGDLIDPSSGGKGFGPQGRVPPVGRGVGGEKVAAMGPAARGGAAGTGRQQEYLSSDPSRAPIAHVGSAPTGCPPVRIPDDSDQAGDSFRVPDLVSCVCTYVP
jgi:hypothetical protein